MLGVMIDCSRNAVMSCDAIKGFVDVLARMEYDSVMLYTEDTYEVNGEPYFGYMRGRYTKDELKDIDIYCKNKGLELIPCIQTLAHCNAIFQISDVYSDVRDCDDILLIDEKRTDELLEHIFATLSECFTSKKIHIGMDEADKVGLGKYLKKHGYKERFDLINHHLHKVCAIAKRYGFEPMLWSDMFCRLAAGTTDYYAGGDLARIREKANLPEYVSLVYWDYYSKDYNHYIKMIQTNKAFERPVVFAGGAWTWKGFAPDNTYSVATTEMAFKACKEEGVGDIIMTMWGDDGAECSRFAVLPALFYASELKRGNTDMEDIKRKFYELLGMEWDSFVLLDELDALGNKHFCNPSKYLLYNDAFTGLNDYRITDEDRVHYQRLTEQLKYVLTKFQERKSTSYEGKQIERIFTTAIALSSLLEQKVTLGVRTRNAYMTGDKELLRELAQTDYSNTIEGLKILYDAFWQQWNAENKPFGFDIQDFRFGGLMQRLESCRKRLLSYIDGDVKKIPELEESLLEGTGKTTWTGFATPNVVSHHLFG